MRERERERERECVWELRDESTPEWIRKSVDQGLVWREWIGNPMSVDQEAEECESRHSVE